MLIVEKIICFKTSLGWVNAVEVKNSIVSISFGKIKEKGLSKQLVKLKNQINNYFLGKSYKWNFKLSINGTTLQKKIWNEIRKIPYGKTQSYGQIAKKIKTSPRYVGNVCSQNIHLLIIPCHRVIRSDGSLGGYSGYGGINLKKKIIKMECK